MADVSHNRGDITSHPDASEMRERYARMLSGRDVALVDGPVFLLGLYCAASPWILHYTTSQPALATHNLIMGIAIGLLALGFTGPEQQDLSSQLGLPFDGRGNVARDSDYQTEQEGVFVAGDAGRGQSLIVWAIAEGRAAAAAVDRYLEGETQLPSPIRPTDRGILV